MDHSAAQRADGLRSTRASRWFAVVATGALVGLAFGVLESLYASYFVAKSVASLLPAALLVLSTHTLSAVIVAVLLHSVSLWIDALTSSPRSTGQRVVEALVASWMVAPIAHRWLSTLAQRRHAGLASLAFAAGLALSVVLVTLVARTSSVWALRGVRGARAAARAATSEWPLALSGVSIIVGLSSLAAATSRTWPLSSSDRVLVVALVALATALAVFFAPVLRATMDRVLPRRSAALWVALALAASAIAAFRMRDALSLVPRGVYLYALVPFAVVGARAWLMPKLARNRGRMVAALAAGLGIAACSLALSARSESARKVVATRAIGAESALRILRSALDFDRDGYPRWVWGGDCRDDDPTVHPGALDWPMDGVDSDCDGRDDVVYSPRRYGHVSVPAEVPEALNVLLVTIDAMRADHVGAYGYARRTTPSLDELARESTLFERAFANAPSTRLSMPAIATGRWAPTIEWDHSIFWPRFTTSQKTIAELLHERGYRTGMVSSIPYFKRADARGFERGVDVYDDSLIGLHAEQGGPAESSGTSSREVADRAIAFVQSSAGRRWFLWAHFFDPHHQYVAHDDGETTFFGTAPVDRYDSEVQYTDRHIGRLLALLRQSREWERTMVIVTGDHGEGFGEHEVSAHGFHLYSAQTRVPMIVRVPGIGARRTRVAVSHVDIAPTIANLTRSPAQRTFLGRTMVDAMVGRGRAEDDGEVLQEVTFDTTTHRWGLVTSTHHLLWNQAPEATRECYDLRHDPDETQDLFGLPALGAPCEALFESLSRSAVALRLGPDYLQQIAFAVLAPGVARPAPEHLVEARFDEHVSLVGWDGPTVIQREAPTTITLHYDVHRPIERGWESFVHLVGVATSRNLDHAVLGGVYPIERWQPGQRLRDRWTFTVRSDVAPGRYALAAGFFRGSTRMAVTQEGREDPLRRALVAWVEVR